MKWVLTWLMLLSVVGCASKTEFGPCVGAFSDHQPNLRYELSTRNTVWAIVFSETLVVPIVVIKKEALCPVGYKH